MDNTDWLKQVERFDQDIDLGCMRVKDGGMWMRFDDACWLVEELKELHSKDRGRTNEHNILVKENRDQAEQLEQAKKKIERVERVNNTLYSRLVVLVDVNPETGESK